MTIIFGFVTLIFATWKDENSKFFRCGSPEFSVLLTQNLVKFKDHFAFLLQKTTFVKFLKKIVLSSKFSSKKIFDQKNILVKKLEAIWYSFVKKERTSKLIKF